MSRLALFLLAAFAAALVPGGAVKERVGACVGGAGGWLCDGAPGHQGGDEGGEKEKGEAGHERSKTLESEGRRPRAHSRKSRAEPPYEPAPRVSIWATAPVRRINER